MTGRSRAPELPEGAWQPERACAQGRAGGGVELFRGGRRRAAPASCAPWRAPRERKEREGAERRREEEEAVGAGGGGERERGRVYRPGDFG